jgi:hypothetical protein
MGLSRDNVRRRPMDTELCLPQGRSCDDHRQKPSGASPMANGPCNTTPHHQPITPSMALPRLTEATNRIKLLTRRSASRDGLWDVTESALKTLQNQFNSRLCILRFLWYAEPFRLVTVGRWLSRINREMSDELVALDNHVRAKATKTIYNQAWTTDSNDDDIRPRRNGPQTVSEDKPYRDCMTIHPKSL